LARFRLRSNSENHYRYDERGYLCASTNARGETTQHRYDASDNLIIERLTQTQRRGSSDPHQPLPDDGLLGRFLGQSHGKSASNRINAGNGSC
jgi:YD repeat-containing protein